MTRKQKIKVAVALTERERDFETFRQEVFTSKRLRDEVKLIRSEKKEHLKRIMPEAEILVCFSIDPETFALARKLKWIHAAFVGVDSMLFPELLKSKVLVTSSRGMHGDTVSDHVMAMILAFAKGLVSSWHCRQDKRWRQVEVMRQRFEPQDKLLGIVGFGTIGESLARKAKAFGMKVMATKNRVKRGEKIRFVDKLLPKGRFREFLCTADFVVLTVPLTEETRHMIKEENRGRGAGRFPGRATEPEKQALGAGQRDRYPAYCGQQAGLLQEGGRDFPGESESLSEPETVVESVR
jgi:phosphoglycerate dehydrogenase-like enzyme